MLTHQKGKAMEIKVYGSGADKVRELMQEIYVYGPRFEPCECDDCIEMRNVAETAKRERRRIQ